MVEQPGALLGGESDDVAGEAGVHVQRPAPRLGMGSDNGVLLHWELGVQFVRRLAEPLSEDPGDVVHRGQGAHPCLHRRRESVVRRFHVGEQGVAAILRNGDRPEDRPE